MPNTSTLNLPLLVLKEIFEILANDTKTLHSCIQTHLAIETYIQEMFLQEKQIIKKHFNISRFVFKLLLPYSSFLRLINISNFMDTVINFWQKFHKNSQDCKIKMISKLLIQLMLNKSTKIQQFKFADLYLFVYPELGNSLLHSLSYLEFNSVEFIQVSLIGFIKKYQLLSKLAIFNCLFENEGDQNNLINQIPIKQLVIYNSTTPVIKLILLCNSSLKTLKIIGYEEEVNLDDLCRFFSNINFRRLFVLLEIAVPYNSQVVSKSIQFDEFGKLEEIESKSLKSFRSYNTPFNILF
ncbi:27720_t:CDS:2 [Dentiscutata erythropus]|uniref:27720_t:CDS:1 n=1 Tax=Dentiscutata erythropus TaxID=1348616 RepID=A0A9N9J7H7_9GLOM|nr:27720_t:CDS:2 [Dentiscutata erythropus]